MDSILSIREQVNQDDLELIVRFEYLNAQGNVIGLSEKLILSPRAQKIILESLLDLKQKLKKDYDANIHTSRENARFKKRK